MDQDRDHLIELLPRSNELLRKTEFATKLVAANVNIIVIVCAVQPAPSFELVDHYILAAENLPAAAAIAINKVDLGESIKIVELIKSNYKHLPYSIIKTSKDIPQSLEKLAQLLINQTCVLVGQSGVGKSTLINSLIPNIDIEVQSISENIQQGKHTTSVTALYDLPQGGEIIDSPGVRDFSPPELDKQKIINGFREIAELGSQCKYHDCIHIDEPDCAVKYAMKKSKLSALRYASYKKIMQLHY